MKKRKIVFLIEDLKFGGVEVSLINLLNSAEFEKHGYEAILIMWDKEYDVLNKLSDDSEVKILKVSDRFPSAIRNLVSKLMGAKKAERIYNMLVRVKVLMYVKREHADVVIRYHHAAMKSLFNCLNDKSKKIMWYHISQDGYYLDKKYTDYCDRIITVNEQCRDIIANARPYLEPKLGVVGNIIDYKNIRSLAKCSEQLFDPETFNAVTCARISPEKGIALALEACRIVSQSVDNFRWYVIGPKDEEASAYYNDIIKKIDSYGLNDKFVLLGSRSNPYKYFAQCDLVVQPSLNESQSLVLREALICGAPIVSTATVGGKATLEDRVTGVIADISAEDISRKICGLISDGNKRVTIKKNIEDIDFSKQNDKVIDDFYRVVDSL